MFLDFTIWESISEIDAEMMREKEMFEASYEGSRFKKLWNFEKEPKGRLHVVKAYDRNKLVGVGLIEEMNERVSMENKGKNLPDGVVSGWLSLYVAPEYRGKGLASRMAEGLIERNKERFSQSVEIPFLVAEGRAWPIAKRLSPSAHVLQDNRDCLRRRNELISFLLDEDWMRETGQDEGKYGTKKLKMEPRNHNEIFSLIHARKYDEVLKALDGDFNPDDIDSTGRNVIDWLVRCSSFEGQANLVEKALEKGVSPNGGAADSVYESSPLEYSVSRNEELSTLLLKYGANPIEHKKRMLNLDAVSLMIKAKNLSLIKEAVKLGVEISSANLYLAISTEDLEMFNEISKHTKFVPSMIHSILKLTDACPDKNSMLKRILKDCPESKIARGVNGQLPIHTCCLQGDLHRAKNFIDEVAHPNVRDWNKRTPLHAACANGNEKLVTYLVSIGSDVGLLDDEERSPLDIAAERGNTNVLALFANQGEDFEKHHFAMEAMSEQGLFEEWDKLSKLSFAVREAGVLSKAVPKEIKSGLKKKI